MKDEKKDLVTNYDEKCKKVAELAKEYSINLKRVHYNYGLDCSKDGESLPKVVKFDIVGTYDYSNKNRKAFIEKVKGLFEIKPNKQFVLDIGLNPRLQGLELPPLKQAIQIFGAISKKKVVQHRSGDYTLIYIWNTRNDRCQKYLKKNSQIISEHPGWSGRLRVVEISNDTKLEDVYHAVKDKLWERIDYYWIQQSSIKNELWKCVFDLERPYYIFVDRDGYIALAGDPDWISIEENVEKWMDGEIMKEIYLFESEAQKLKGKEIKDPNVTIEQCYEILKKFREENRSDFRLFKELYYTVSIHRVFTKDKPLKQFAELSIHCNCYDKYKPANEKLLHSLKKTLETIMESSERCEVTSMGVISFGKECDRCGCKLGECDQYRCVSCSDKFYCINCLKPRDNIKSEKDLIHKHAFYFIQKDSKEMLDELKIVSVDTNEIKEILTEHEVYCCMCNEEKKTKIVWRCANCKRCFCDNCFRITRKPSNPRYSEYREAAERVGHDIRTHIYIREDISGQLAYHY